MHNQSRHGFSRISAYRLPHLSRLRAAGRCRQSRPGLRSERVPTEMLTPQVRLQAGTIHMAVSNGRPAAMATALLTAALALQLLAPAAGHGMMINPRSRNWAGYLQDNFAWAHGLNMGGGWVAKGCDVVSQIATESRRPLGVKAQGRAQHGPARCLTKPGRAPAGGSSA
jgi:hypothetical protein